MQTSNPAATPSNSNFEWVSGSGSRAAQQQRERLRANHGIYGNFERHRPE